MTERESEVQLDAAVPQSIEQLFTTLRRSLVIDRPGLSVENSVSPQEFEWITQEILQECMQLDDEQVRAFARTLTHQTHISPRYLKASVTRVGDFLSSLAQLLAVHPATILDGEERQEVLADSHWYHKTITGAYEIMEPKYDAGEANAIFVRRVVGATAIHLEQLELPHFLQEDEVEATAGNLLIGVTALRGARYISRGQHRHLTNRILSAQDLANAGKPADVLFVPAEWSNNL